MKKRSSNHDRVAIPIKTRFVGGVGRSTGGRAFAWWWQVYSLPCLFLLFSMEIQQGSLRTNSGGATSRLVCHFSFLRFGIMIWNSSDCLYMVTWWSSETSWFRRLPGALESSTFQNRFFWIELNSQRKSLQEFPAHRCFVSKSEVGIRTNVTTIPSSTNIPNTLSLIHPEHSLRMSFDGHYLRKPSANMYTRLRTRKWNGWRAEFRRSESDPLSNLR